MVLGLKYGDKSGGIVTSSAGAIHYQIEFSAFRQNNEEIADIMEPLSRKILLWQKLADPEKKINIFIKEINAKASSFSIADHASVRLVATYNNHNDKETLDSAIKEIAVKSSKNKIVVATKRTLSREPLHETAQKVEAYTNISQLASKIGLHIGKTHRSYSSNICFVPNEVLAFDGFGPLGGAPRSPQEYIIKDSIPDRALLLAMILYGAGKK